MASPVTNAQRPHARPGADSSDDSASFSPWLLVWTILVAKLGTLAIIIVVARSSEGGALIAVTSLPWVALGAALAMGPVLFHVRLRRVRARREELRRQEWMGQEAPRSPRHHRLPVSRETGR